MKNTIAMFLLSGLLYSLCFSQGHDLGAIAQTTPGPLTTELTVHLYNLDSDVGQLMVAIYDKEEAWLNTSMKGEISKIVNGEATVVFKDIPYGEYAISSFHDEDSNGKLKTGIFGIPTEAYASSRGAIGMFGPPKWVDAIFTLDSATAIEKIKF